MKNRNFPPLLPLHIYHRQNRETILCRDFKSEKAKNKRLLRSHDITRTNTRSQRLNFTSFLRFTFLSGLEETSKLLGVTVTRPPISFNFEFYLNGKERNKNLRWPDGINSLLRVETPKKNSFNYNFAPVYLRLSPISKHIMGFSRAQNCIHPKSGSQSLPVLRFPVQQDIFRVFSIF